jgi:hypothetical protein
LDEVLREAVVGDSEEEIEVQTPVFERRDGIEPDAPPATPTEYDLLKTLNDEELAAIGLQKWSDDEDGCLWLFPGEWHEHIPEGYEVQTINREYEAFDPEISGDDQRFGMLAYGISPADKPDYATDEPWTCGGCGENLSEKTGAERTVHLLTHADESVRFERGDGS